jgi:hypothetical protein
MPIADLPLFLVYEFVPHLLKCMNRRNQLFFVQKDVVGVECGDGEDADFRLCQRLKQGNQDAHGLERDRPFDAHCPPSLLLLDVVRGHEFRGNDRQFIVGPHDEAHLTVGDDLRQPVEYGELADGELFIEEPKLQLLHRRGR